MLKYCLVLLFFVHAGYNAPKNIGADSDRVCGKWMSSENSLVVQVYKNGDRFKAKVVWFKDHPAAIPMEECCDKHNPNPALRNRKLVGMDVLNGLKYDAESDSWEDGIIYDAQQGKEWNASAYINKEGLLKVKGYWHWKIFGRTMSFKRVP
jgi:uncharacterized protein (DUF2147 family)